MTADVLRRLQRIKDAAKAADAARKAAAARKG